MNDTTPARWAQDTLFFEVTDSTPEKKPCLRCGEVKLLEDFSKQKKNTDGRQTTQGATC